MFKIGDFVYFEYKNQLLSGRIINTSVPRFSGYEVSSDVLDCNIFVKKVFKEPKYV